MGEPAKTSDPFQLSGATIEGKYRIASVVGDGGFGVVYRGVHTGFGELIAVKCLKMPRDLDAAQRESLLDQLREEGRILHRLSRATSGIVQALDVGAFTTESGTWVPYLVLEWLEGQTLGEFMEARAKRGEGGLSIDEAIRLLEPAARALAVAHGQKVAHRDVKPANLFLTESLGARTLKVLDFGIAKVLTNHPTITAALEATKMGPTAFTPRYGAPEQFNKKRGASGPWTDVFALALIFVELVSGKRALDGDDPTQLYIAAADPTSRPTLRERGVAAPAAVDRVLEKALSVEPKHRYPDAGAFWDALRAAASTGGPAVAPAETNTPDVVRPSQGMLATAEFAAARSLDVQADDPTRTPPVERAPTIPVESLRSRATSPEVRAASPSSEAPAAPPAASSDTAAAASPAASAPPADDPMVETPISARARDVLVRRSAPSAGEMAPPPSEVPGAPAAERSPAPSTGRAVWPWLVGAAALGAGGLVWLRPWSTPSSTVPSATTLAPARDAGALDGAAPVRSAVAPSLPPSASAPVASASATAAVPTPPEGMVYVAPGTVQLASGATATVARGFFLDRAEVTTATYRACVAKRACGPATRVLLTRPPDDSDLGPEALAEVWTRRCNEVRSAVDHPVNCVDWASADAFCRSRNARLPTEAEWTLAARGAAGREFPWGADAPACDTACWDRNGHCRVAGEEVATCVSGQPPKDATPEGVIGLGGNVAEWVAGSTDGEAIALGGSFLSEAPTALRGGARTTWPPTTAHVTIGFRCAQDLP